MNYWSARVKYLALTFGTLPAGVIVITMFAFRWNDLIALLMFPWVILVQHLSGRIECPVCKRPIGFGRFKILFISFEWWKAIPARRCEYPNEPSPRTANLISQRAPTLARQLVCTTLGASLILVGSIQMMVSSGKMGPCGELCSVASTVVNRIGVGSSSVLGPILIAIGVLVWASPKWRKQI